MRKTLSSLAKALLALVLVLMACEGLARLFLTSPSTQIYDAALGYVNRPGAVHFQTREGFQAVRLNSLGLNDRPLNAPRDRPRLLFIGDSMTFAAQVPTDANFTSQIERLDGVDAVNGGRDALGPHQWLARIDQLAPIVAPDLTVIVMSRGDGFDLRDAKAVILRDAMGQPMGVRAPLADKDQVQAAIGPLMAHSSLVTYLARRAALAVSTVQNDSSWISRLLLRRGRPAAVARGTGGDRLPDTTEPQLTDLLRLVRARGALLVVSLPAFHYLPKGQSVYEPRSVAEAAVFRRAAAAAQVDYLDLTGPMQAAYARDGRPLTGFNTSKLGEGHLNGHGHDVVAKAIAAAVVTALAAEKPPGHPADKGTR